MKPRIKTCTCHYVRNESRYIRRCNAQRDRYVGIFKLKPSEATCIVSIYNNCEHFDRQSPMRYVQRRSTIRSIVLRVA